MSNRKKFKDMDELLRTVAGMQELYNGKSCDRLDELLKDPQDELLESDLEWVRAARGEVRIPDYLKKKTAGGGE